VPTTIDLAADLATAVAALPSTPTRLASDYRTDLERLADGSTYSQIRVSPAGTSSIASNQFRTIAAASVRLHHKLLSAFGERTYTEGDLQDDLSELISETFWRGLDSVYDLTEAPEVIVDRVGNVVSSTVTILVVLK
jgi:hypothetical protein